jgi:hypothetical protein
MTSKAKPTIEISGRDASGPAFDSVGRRFKTLDAGVDKLTSRFEGLAGSIGRGFLAGLSLTAVTRFVAQTGEAGAAIERLSRLSNQSAEDFQRYAAGARSVGIEQDKLADIFKDTQDKVGDFLTTGGGPLADFFEKIAPQVGVTAEQFRNLGGKDALQLYVNSLQGANLSQSEMVFFLEAIASDSALLLPLLQDNGRGFKELGDQAERLGGILSDEAVRSAAEFDRNLEKLSSRVLGLARDIAGPLIAALNDLFQLSERGQRQGGGFLTGYLDQLKEDFARAREIATREQLELARPGFDRAQAILARQPDSIRAKATVAEFRELEAAARRYREEVQAASAFAFPSSNLQGGRGTITPAFARKNDQPKKKTPEEIAAEKAAARNAARFAEEQRLLSFITSDFGSEQSDAETARLSRYEEILAALPDVIIPVQTAQEELTQAFLQSEKAAYDIDFDGLIEELDKVDARTEQFLANVQDAFGQTLLSTFQDSTDGILDLWGDMLLRMISEALAADLVGALTGKGSTNNLETLSGNFASIIGSLFGSANGNAFGPAGLIPFAAGGVVNAPTVFGFGGGQAGLMGEAGPEAILPLKRGRGGVLGVSGANVQNNITIQTLPGTTAESSERGNDSGGIDTIIRIVDKRMAAGVRGGGSETGRAMRETFGLSRTAGAPRRG